jgi:hypothetical protein
MGNYVDGKRDGMWQRLVDGPIGIEHNCRILHYDMGEVVSIDSCGPSPPKELSELFRPDSANLDWVPRKPLPSELECIKTSQESSPP